MKMSANAVASASKLLAIMKRKMGPYLSITEVAARSGASGAGGQS